MYGPTFRGVAALWLALFACPGRSENHETPDFTAYTLEQAQIKATPMHADPKTGFVVGGKNATAAIRRLSEINGRSIAELERDMRPGAYSQSGFLGPEERLLDVMAADNEFVVDELGLAHQELAKHLHIIGAVGLKLRHESKAKAWRNTWGS